LKCRLIAGTPRVIEVAKRGLRTGETDKSQSKNSDCDYDCFLRVLFHAGGASL